MHTNTKYKFDTEAEAKAFVEKQLANKSPIEDKYVRGPFFMDEDVIFKNMMWASAGNKWWQVDVESYS